ncbi:MAG: hypothetical protein AABX27_02140 [Nanoarchaeota archaeon]
MITSQLEQKLNMQKARIGLTGGRLKVYESADAEEPISACIEPGDWHIEIALKEGLNPVADKRAAFYAKKKGIKNPLEKICEDMLYHECGHWELPRGSKLGCPYDEKYHDLITESVSNALSRHGKQDFAGYVANAFEDVLVNINCRQRTDFAGQMLFWTEQGLAKGKFGKFYEAFVKLNIALWGDRIDNAFLKRWYANAPEVDESVKKIMSSWNISQAKGLEGIQDNVANLYVKERWEQLAAEFADIIAPLLDEQPKQQMFGAGNDGKPNGKKGGSAFDKKLGTGEGKEKVSYARYSSGKGMAQSRDSFEQLDALYRMLARDIPVEIETFTKSYSFPLVPFGREEFDPEQHDLIARCAKIGLHQDGTVGIDVNKGWIQTSEVYKHNIRKFPKFRLALLDSSGTMKSAPDGSGNIGSTAFIPWGDNSRYHYALLGYYGIERFLQAQHIAPYVDAGAINFSSASISASGEDARKVLLTPQWGGTVIGISELRNAVQKGETFLLSLSDGDISGWGGIRDEFKSIVSSCAYAHIQLGPATPFSNDLKSWGIPVYPVMAGNDMAKLMVKIAGNEYKDYGRGNP